MSTSEIATRDEAEAALLAAQEDVLEEDSFQTPILKLGQPLTAEVRAGDAEAGDFINSLTGENLGNAIEFIVSFYQRGRSARDAKTGDYYLAFGDTIPPSWEPLVGEEFVGTVFTEYPDAEEVYKQRVNSNEIEWGKGPLVSTTYNYTGHVIVPEVVGDEDSEPQLQAVRLSLQRSNKKSADKIGSIKRSLLHNKPFWDKVFLFTTQEDPKSSYGNFILTPKVGRDTTAEEREQAKSLALALMGGRVEVKGEDADPQEGGAASEPQAADGALAV